MSKKRTTSSQIERVARITSTKMHQALTEANKDTPYSYVSFNSVQNLIMDVMNNAPGVEAGSLMNKLNNIQMEASKILREKFKDSSTLLLSLFEKGHVLVNGDVTMFTSASIETNREFKWYPDVSKPNVVYVPLFKLDNGNLWFPERPLGFVNLNDAFSAAASIVKSRQPDDKEITTVKNIGILAVSLYEIYDLYMSTRGALGNCKNMTRSKYPIYHYTELDMVSIDNLCLTRYLLGEFDAWNCESPQTQTTNVFEKWVIEQTGNGVYEHAETDKDDVNFYFYGPLLGHQIDVRKADGTYIISEISDRAIKHGEVLPLEGNRLYTEVFEREALMKSTYNNLPVNYVVKYNNLDNKPPVVVLQVESKSLTLADNELDEQIYKAVINDFKDLHPSLLGNEYQFSEISVIPGMKDKYLILIHRHHPSTISTRIKKRSIEDAIKILSANFHQSLQTQLNYLKKALYNDEVFEQLQQYYRTVLVKNDKGYKLISDYSDFSLDGSSFITKDFYQVMAACGNEVIYYLEDTVVTVKSDFSTGVPLLHAQIEFIPFPALEDNGEMKMTLQTVKPELSHIHGTFFTDLHADRLILGTFDKTQFKQFEGDAGGEFAVRIGKGSGTVAICTGMILITRKEKDDKPYYSGEECGPVVFISRLPRELTNVPFTGFCNNGHMIAGGYQTVVPKEVGFMNKKTCDMISIRVGKPSALEKAMAKSGRLASSVVGNPVYGMSLIVYNQYLSELQD